MGDMCSSVAMNAQKEPVDRRVKIEEVWNCLLALRQSLERKEFVRFAFKNQDVLIFARME
tara:strand:- start:6324 stop:6503 length:180 start_codon:yes stop_codon:yes gene_type:complete